MKSTELPTGSVRRLGHWAVVRRGDGSTVALGARCRHQFADLSNGSIDDDGCLVCPWHGARYDTHSGAMVDGPRGFLGYHGPAPGYSALVLALGRVARLRVRRVTDDGGELTVP